MAAVSLAAIGLLAGCSSSSSSSAAAGATVTASASGPAAGTGATGAATSAVASASASSVAFAAITEPFDPGHAATPKSSPASCDGQSTTLAIEQCFENKTETADAAIDTLRQASFAGASAAQQAAINAADTGWLSARGPVCAKAYQTGGTIDGINASVCLLDESTARLDALKGITPPEAVLKSTDSTSLSDLSWYTTPEGSRIAMIDTQGDETGGAIIAWVIIAGSDGFVVNPAQFPYRDGSFTDAGIVQGPNPAGHKVATGTVYQFSIDYSHLSAAPDKGKNGGWVYPPGTPVAVWR
jgi:uncharacterized protein YecT (DUF1311 family)